jgi:hypothetical protein
MIGKTVLTIHLLYITTLIAGQETTLKIRESNGIYEEFYVLKNNKKNKEGTYVKYVYNVLGQLFILETGFYKNNLKNEYWQTFVWNQVKEVRKYLNDTLNGEYYSFYIDTLGVEESSKISDYKGKRNDSLMVSISEDFQYLKEKGQYKNNERDSVWNFYTLEGSIYFSYDFSKDSLLFDKNNYKDSIRQTYAARLPCYKGGGIAGLSLEILPRLINYKNVDSISFNCLFLIKNDGSLEEVLVNSESNPRYINKNISKQIKLNYNWAFPSSSEERLSYNLILKMVKKEKLILVDFELVI